MTKSMQAPPVFIIGSPRSGTTLLAAMMNAHARLSCGNETHFFDRLTHATCAYITDPRYWPIRACNYIRKLHHIGMSMFSIYQIDFNDYRTALTNERPSMSAILNCFMKIYLSRTGKFRWVEKTPSHLKQFTIIRECFPDSPVICIFRDPRDVALSLMNVTWGVSSFLDGLLVWHSFYEHYMKYITKDTHVLKVKFEDLVRNPLEINKQICGFINEEFDYGMLDTSRAAVDVGSAMEPYKQNVAKPADSGRAFAWINKLPKHDLLLTDRLLRSSLAELRYPFSTEGSDTCDDYMNGEFRLVLDFLGKQNGQTQKI